MKKGKEILLVLLAVMFVLPLPVKGESFQKIILGQSKIVIPKYALVGTQVDRVIRDIAWKNSQFDKRRDPFLIPRRSQLVPYMEGRLSGILMDYAGVEITGLTPSRAIRKKNDYYSDDGNNHFSFRISPDKTKYETAMFSPNHRKALFVDTHGFNMIAGQAIRINKIRRIFLAIACMDMPAKAKAALYLAKNGINCYGPCDRFAYKNIGYKDKYPIAATIIGTAPIRPYKQGAIIGNQPVEISVMEKIVIEYTEREYPDQYCDTPTRYFEALNKKYKLGLKLVRALANAGEAYKVTAKAVALKASVIGVRVWNREDAAAVSKWLKGDLKRRAILFHSAAYEPGYKMFFRFPERTSFGDLSPKFE